MPLPSWYPFHTWENWAGDTVLADMIIDASIVNNIQTGLTSFIGSLVNVKLYGAVGNGIADDTIPIQEALNDWASANPGAVLYFPVGTYLISDTLIIPFTTGKIIQGTGQDACIIRQSTSNVPILKTQTHLTHSITLRDIGFEYVIQQTDSEPNSYGIMFTSVTNADFFSWRISDCRFYQCFRGIGISGSSGLQITVFSSIFENLLFQSLVGAALWFASPSPIGMPNNAFTVIQVNNTNTSVINVEEAVHFSACETFINGLQVEGWHNWILYVSGGSILDVRQVHIEHHVLDHTGGGVWLFYISNGLGFFHNVHIAMEQTVPGQSFLFEADNGGIVYVDGGRVDVIQTDGVTRLIHTTNTALGSFATNILDDNVNTQNAIDMSGSVVEISGSGIPVNGSWNPGDRVWAIAPVAGGFMGWVCITAGTPGTWKQFGLISG